MTDLDEKKALIRKVLDEKRAAVVCADDVKYLDEVEHNDQFEALGYRLEIRHEHHCRVSVRSALPLRQIREDLLNHSIDQDLRELSDAYWRDHDDA